MDSNIHKLLMQEWFIAIIINIFQSKNKVYKVNYDYSRFIDERSSITVWYDIGKVGLKKLQKPCLSDIKNFLTLWITVVLKLSILLDVSLLLQNVITTLKKCHFMLQNFL